ncbi:MAG: MBL fold metallo-hydrolase [Patescibacteria group bacterium]|jgi:L-ascorbate metabolism protein UlaG (beta-lactamase superfamily)
MQIAYNGLGSFTITAKPMQADVTLVTNPFTSPNTKFKSQVASLVVSSHDGDDANNFKAVEPEHPEDHKKVFNIPHAGEYEVGGVAVAGVDATRKDGTAHTIYRFDIEGVKVGFLGALDRTLSEKEVEGLGPIDILIVPAGGKNVLTASQAAEVVAQIEPRMVIPSYVDGGDDYGMPDALKRELGCPTEEVNKLKIVKSGLPEEDMKLVIFTK